MVHIIDAYPTSKTLWCMHKRLDFVGVRTRRCPNLQPTFGQFGTRGHEICNDFFGCETPLQMNECLSWPLVYLAWVIRLTYLHKLRFSATELVGARPTLKHCFQSIEMEANQHKKSRMMQLWKSPILRPRLGKEETWMTNEILGRIQLNSLARASSSSTRMQSRRNQHRERNTHVTPMSVPHAHGYAMFVQMCGSFDMEQPTSHWFQSFKRGDASFQTLMLMTDVSFIDGYEIILLYCCWFVVQAGNNVVMEIATDAS